MTKDEQASIVRVLCSQALADHLGDIRDAEEALWKLLDARELHYTDPVWDKDSAFLITEARLKANGYDLPEHLLGSLDD